MWMLGRLAMMLASSGDLVHQMLRLVDGPGLNYMPCTNKGTA